MDIGILIELSSDHRVKIQYRPSNVFPKFTEVRLNWQHAKFDEFGVLRMRMKPVGLSNNDDGRHARTATTAN